MGPAQDQHSSLQLAAGQLAMPTHYPLHFYHAAFARHVQRPQHVAPRRALDIPLQRGLRVEARTKHRPEAVGLLSDGSQRRGYQKLRLQLSVCVERHTARLLLLFSETKPDLL